MPPWTISHRRPIILVTAGIILALVVVMIIVAVRRTPVPPRAELREELTQEIIEKYYTVTPGTSPDVLDAETIRKYYTVPDEPSHNE